MKIMERMKRFFTLNACRTDGFTLVELIVVIAILAILGGVAVPAYSGYVAKAEYAADEQLLATINKAYAAACLENGTDIALMKNQGGASLNLADDKTVEEVEPFNEEFALYYAGNGDSAFKVMEDIVYSPSRGMFCDANTAPDVMVNGYWADRASIDAFKNSGLADLPTDVLMNIVGAAADALSGGDVGADDFAAIIGSSEFADAAAKVLGLKDAAAYNAYIDAQKAAAKEQYLEAHKNDGLSNTALQRAANAAAADAVKNIQTNLMPMVGAIKAEEAGTNIIDVLKDPNGKQTILNNINGKNNGDPTLGMAQTALAYALYTSYAENNNKGTDMGAFILALSGSDDGAFQAYLSDSKNADQVQADLDGALGVMDIINKQDTSVKQDTVENGLTNSNLSNALLQILGK